MTQNVWYAQVGVPDRKSICPDRPRRKLSMSRSSQTESAYVQTFVRSKFFVRSSCVQKSSCPDFRAFKITYVQTFVRSKVKFVRSKIDNLCVHVQTIVRSKGLMSRLSCVRKCLCPDLLWVPKENSCAPKLIICAFMSRLSCVQKGLCPDFLCVQKLSMCTKIDDLICPKKLFQNGSVSPIF